MKKGKFSALMSRFMFVALLSASPNGFTYHGVASIDLKGLLDVAWVQNGSAALFERKKEALIDKSELAKQFFPGSAQLGISLDSDAPFKDEGRREYGLRLQTPVWLPGQRQALSREVGAEVNLLLAEERFQRWRLAGQLRTLYWEVMVARNDLKLAERKREVSEKLVINVSKRVQAGELAEIDLLLSKQKKLAAESELLLAKQSLAKSQLVFNGLAGKDAPEDWLSEEAQSLPIESHPSLSLILRQLTLSQAKLEKLRAGKRAAPRFGLGVRREREDRDEGYQNMVGLDFTLPFENAVVNKSRFAEALALKSAIESRYIKEKQQRVKSIELAKLAVIHAKKSYEIYERLKQLAVEHFILMRNAFNIGEVGLRELLLVQSESDLAVESSARQKVEVARTISMLNQEQGAFP